MFCWVLSWKKYHTVAERKQITELITKCKIISIDHRLRSKPSGVFGKIMMSMIMPIKTPRTTRAADINDLATKYFVDSMNAKNIAAK